MLNARFLFLLLCESLHDFEGLHFHTVEDEIQHFVGEKLKFVRVFDIPLVELVKLGLALVELV